MLERIRIRRQIVEEKVGDSIVHRDHQRAQSQHTDMAANNRSLTLSAESSLGDSHSGTMPPNVEIRTTSWAQGRDSLSAMIQLGRDLHGAAVRVFRGEPASLYAEHLQRHVYMVDLYRKERWRYKMCAQQQGG